MDETLTYPDLVDLRTIDGFLGVGGYSAPREMTIGQGPEAREAEVAAGSHDLFTTLGVLPARGRFFTPDEDRVEAPATAVIGWDYWMRAFGGTPDVIGATLEVSGVDHTVIGVAPRGFTGVGLERVDLWLPIERFGALAWGSDGFRESRGTWWMDAVARISDEDRLPAAEARASAMHVNARSEDVEAGRYDAEARIFTGPLIAARGPSASDESRVAGWLIGVAALVLLIACANIANLLLARAVQRRRERAIRLSLGVSQWRLAHESLLEILLLALGGGAVAVLLAGLGGSFVRSALIPEVHWVGHGIDLRVFVFTVGAALAAALLAGAGPAVRNGRTELADELRSGGRGAVGRRSRARSALAVGQVGLSVVLLVGAGLFVRSLHEVRQLDLGFDPDRVVTATLELMAAEPEPSEAGRIHEAAARELRGVAGVRSVALTNVPFGWSYAQGIRVPGLDSIPRLPGGGPYYHAVDEHYFETLGLAVVRGRGFDASDRADGAAVAVVSETMAETLWPDADALGQCFHRGSDGDTPCTTVVGVIEDASRGSLQERAHMTYYVPLEPSSAPRALFVRADGDAGTVASRIAPLLRSYSPEVRFARVETLRDAMDPQARAWSLGASLFTAFGLLALLVASVGLYSLLAFDVAERTREIGIRAALGARRVELLHSVLLRGVRLAALGVMSGIAVALTLAPRVEALLFGVLARDPRVIATVAVVLLLVSAMAGALPALRATKVDPMAALRAD